MTDKTKLIGTIENISVYGTKEYTPLREHLLCLLEDLHRDLVSLKLDLKKINIIYLRGYNFLDAKVFYTYS